MKSRLIGLLQQKQLKFLQLIQLITNIKKKRKKKEKKKKEWLAVMETIYKDYRTTITRHFQVEIFDNFQQ